MNYIKKNKKFWNYNYESINVESVVFRIKNRLLNKYIDFKKKNNFKVLDFGCGQGANLSYFEKTWKFDVYGVDIAPLMVKVARKSISNKTVLKINKISESRELYFIVIKRNKENKLVYTKHLIVGWELEDDYEPVPLIIPDFDDSDTICDFINIGNTYISKDEKCKHMSSIEEVLEYVKTTL